MAHFERERTDARWYQGLLVPPETLLNIDEKTKKAISGTGGTHTPSAPVIIGGAGLELQSAVQFSGTAAAFPATGKNYTFGDDDYFKYANEQTLTVDDAPFLAGQHLELHARQARLVIVPTHLQFIRTGARVRLPLRLPDGARLVEVVLRFIVGSAHTSVPEFLPTARVVRIDKNGVVEPHPTFGSAADPNGWHQPIVRAPASGANWYLAATLQTMTLPFNYVDAIRADRSTYDYALEWVDEHGDGAYNPLPPFGDPANGNRLFQILVTYRITDLRPY